MKKKENFDPLFYLQVLLVDVAKMLPRTGTSGQNDTHWPTDSPQISHERYSKPEIQHYYISSNGEYLFKKKNI